MATSSAINPPTGKKPAAGEASDRSLLNRFRAGSQDAATALYLRYAHRLHALARRQFAPGLAVRIDPEDIVQSVFRTFFRRASQGAYEVPDGDELWKLFLVISLNKIRAAGAHHRAAKRDVRATTSGEATAWASQADATQDVTALNILRIVVDDVLNGLSESHRRMVELRIAGHEVAEIARQSGRAKRSVERVLQAFRTMLSDLVSEDD